MTLSFWQQNARESTLDFDVAVVGGGIIGCSTAFWLNRLQPDLRIAVVEAGRLAGGASGRNAGFLLQGTSRDYATDLKAYGPEHTRRLWQFTRENRDLIFSELNSQAIHLEPSGSLTVAATLEEDARLQAGVSRMRADGAPVAYLPPEETNRRLLSRGFLGSLYVPSGAMLHPVQLVRYLAEGSGATVLEHHPVVELGGGEGEALLETSVRRIRARKVVLALNAYLPRLLPELGKYVSPVRAQMLATGPAQFRWLRLPAYSHEGFFYIRQTDDGTLLVGGARHMHVKEERGYDDMTTAHLQADLEAYLREHFPKAQGAQIRHRWSGVMGFSPDYLPAVGQVPGLPGSFWAAGFTGHGMGYGFRFGKLLAELSLGHAQPEGYDLFTADRFASLPAEPARKKRVLL